MGGAVALAVNIHYALDKTSIGFALLHVAIRIFLIMEYIRTGRKFIVTRPLTSKYGMDFTVLLWLMSIFVPPPFRYAVWILVLFLDILITVVITTKHLDLSPNTFHLSELFGIFVIIVLGDALLHNYEIRFLLIQYYYNRTNCDSITH